MIKSCTQHLIVRLPCSWFVYCFHKPDEKLSQWNRGCQESIVKDGKQGEKDEVCKNWTDSNCGGWIQIGEFGSNFSQYIQRWVFTVMFKILGAAFQPVDTKYCQSLVQRAVTSGKCLGTASFFMIPRTLHVLDIKHTISHGWAVPEPGPPPSSSDSSSDCCCWRGLTSSWPRTELKETRLQRRALEYLSWSVENNYWWLFNDITRIPA